MPTQNSGEVDRRQFVKSAAAVAAAALAAPAIAAPAVNTASKTDSQIVLGEGDHRYVVHHGWAQLPKEFEWQTTHNCTVDRNGLVYVIHEGRDNRRGHPTIFVFDGDGKYIRSFGNQFAGGAHGMDLRNEGGEEFLYVTSYRPKMFCKLSLKGEEVWRRHAPMESGKYAPGEDVDNHVYGQRDSFMPTNICFLPDGDFLVADGYGSFWIHRYDKDANWKSCFGGPGDGDTTFINPHGLWYDNRPGREPAVVITDRVRHKLKYFTPEGQYLSTVEGFLLPCHFDLRGDTMLIPDLNSRVTLLDRDNQPLAHLANYPDWQREVDAKKLRLQPDSWEAGKFVHPHDACFDHDGNIIVTEWVEPGRVSKLTRLV
jgi:hypothetical protein